MSRFHHVAIRAAHLDATIRFYTEGLGCSVRYEFSVPGRIDRAAFWDAGVAALDDLFESGIKPATTITKSNRVASIRMLGEYTFDTVLTIVRAVLVAMAHSITAHFGPHP